MNNKNMRLFLFFILAITSITAAPKAVVFDYGGVLANPNREMIKKFICNSLHLSSEEFEQSKPYRKIAMNKGLSHTDCWLQYAKIKGVTLPMNWAQDFKNLFREALGIDLAMFRLIDQLKEKNISVGLLSNIGQSSANEIRSLGIYAPFNPCLLSCEIGVEKPDPRAYQILLEKIALPPQDILFIDDRMENVEAAKKVGLDSILFTSPSQIKHELRRKGAL